MPFRPHALGSSLRAGSANVHIGDSWTALDQVGPNGTLRPVTCDLVTKLGCARSAVVQLPRRSSSGNAPDLLVRCSIEIPVLPFSQQGHSPNPRRADHPGRVGLPRRVLGAGAWHGFGQARIVAAEKLQTKDSLSNMKW